jgi:hypothetical protein
MTVSPTGGDNFNGTLIANSFIGQMEFHDTGLFAGDLPGSVLEPLSVVLAGTGLTLISPLPRKRGVRRRAGRA